MSLWICDYVLGVSLLMAPCGQGQDADSSLEKRPEDPKTSHLHHAWRQCKQCKPTGLRLLSSSIFVDIGGYRWTKLSSQQADWSTVVPDEDPGQEHCMCRMLEQVQVVSTKTPLPVDVYPNHLPPSINRSSPRPNQKQPTP